MKTTSIQIFMVMGSLKKTLIVFFYQQSVFKMGENYYPWIFLEDCKYIVKEKKVSKYINDDLNVSSDDSDDCNEDASNESNEKASDKSDEKICNKE